MKYFERDFARWSYDLRPPHFVTDPSADDFLDGCGGCRTTAANELPRHGSADEDDLPQTAEDTCTALGDHTLCDQMKVAQHMKRRSRTRHVRAEAISCIAHGDDGVVRCSPATRPSPARSCLPRLTATRACRDHHNHRGAPQAAHSAEAIRLCVEGKQKWIRTHFSSVRWPGRAADLTSTPPTAITGCSAPR